MIPSNTIKFILYSLFTAPTPLWPRVQNQHGPNSTQQLQRQTTHSDISRCQRSYIDNRDNSTTADGETCFADFDNRASEEGDDASDSGEDENAQTNKANAASAARKEHTFNPMRSPPILCAKCNRSFDTVRDRTLHIRNSPKHNCCRECQDLVEFHSIILTLCSHYQTPHPYISLVQKLQTLLRDGRREDKPRQVLDPSLSLPALRSCFRPPQIFLGCRVYPHSISTDQSGAKTRKHRPIE